MRCIVLLIFMASFANGAHGQGVWTVKDTVNGDPKASCVSFVVNGFGYLGLGVDQTGVRRSFYNYDWWSDDWDKDESLGGINGSGLGRSSAIGFSAHNKGYVGLGHGAAPFYQDFWEFDPDFGTWSQKASFIGSARTQAVAFALDDMGYVGTGADASGLTQDFYRYEPLSNSWTQLNDFPGTARKEATAFSMGGQGYLGTGEAGVFLRDFWQYEPSTDTWTQKLDFPASARTGASGWGVFPNAYLATGYDTSYSYKNDVWEYNYFSNSWTQVTDYPGAGRTNAVSFVVNGRAYLGTGYNGAFLNDFYEYEPLLNVKEQSEGKLNLYPNPTIDQFFISLEDENIKVVEFFDGQGKEQNNQFRVAIMNNGLEVNSSASPGIYYLRIQTKEGTSFFNSVIIR